VLTLAIEAKSSNTLVRKYLNGDSTRSCANDARRQQMHPETGRNRTCFRGVVQGTDELAQATGPARPSGNDFHEIICIERPQCRHYQADVIDPYLLAHLLNQSAPTVQISGGQRKSTDGRYSYIAKDARQ
jgi:hypothetical protein